MKMNNLTLICTVILFALFITACGDDDGNGNVDCNDSVAVNNEIADEITAIGEAVNVFTTDPSPANCEALKTAYQNYIDELKNLQSCANDAGVGDDFADAITSSEASIGNLTC